MKIRLEIKKIGSTVLPIPPEEAPRNRANPIMEPEAIKLSIRSANNLIRAKKRLPTFARQIRQIREISVILINETRKWMARWKSKVLKFAWLRENFKYLWHRKVRKFCKIRVFNEYNTWLFVYSWDFRSFLSLPPNWTIIIKRIFYVFFTIAIIFLKYTIQWWSWKREQFYYIKISLYQATISL